MLEITPNLDPASDEPMYLQLYEYLKDEIQKKRIPANGKLPSQRRLSSYLNISRNTVDAAYQQLVAEGYVISEERRGLFVAEMQDTFLLAGLPHDALQSGSEGEAAGLEGPAQKYAFDFKYGEVDLTHFPFKLWRQMMMKSIMAEQNSVILAGEPQGELGLRKQISEYIYQSRGVNCREEQIVIGAGTQYLLSMLCKIIGREHGFGVEDPGYDQALLVIKDYAKQVEPIPLDKHGLSVVELMNTDVKAVYVTPSHQFPTGTVMPISRRLELIEWAKNNDGYVIEDDYDSEFRYEGRPIPSLHSLDMHGNTVYLGTFSKLLMPSIRISFMVLPEKLLGTYNERYAGYKQTVSKLDQHTLEMFMESGEWSKHLNKARNIYKKRHHALLTAIKDYMKDSVQIIGSASGLHLVLEPRNGMTEEELIAAAQHNGVLIYPMSAFYEKKHHSGNAQVLLGFGGLNEERIREGVSLLCEAWFRGR
ncbi:PLP-dependent aminotransferase family protein [Paenibacillus hubeiensis]|uniref:MocR-like pyridoxine biosynthesis transcription factor PdxR n=1 Tax=Paenibacillus hubeiensis TaxID=3077330 RepID=UPI0031B9D009